MNQERQFNHKTCDMKEIVITKNNNSFHIVYGQKGEHPNHLSYIRMYDNMSIYIPMFL